MTDVAENIDNAVDNADETAQLPEHEADAPPSGLIEAAKLAGWKPPEEHEGRNDFLGPEDYLKFVAEDRRRLRDENKRFGQVIEADRRETAKRAREEALRELREAKADADPDRIERAAQRVEQAVTQADPEVESWVSRNTWFHTDPAAAAVAQAVSARLGAEGRSTREQLEAAEAAVKSRFPEHFPQTAKPVQRKAPPMVQQPTRAAVARPQEKSFASLPKTAQDAYRKYFQPRGVTEDGYARTYWADQSEGV